MDKLPESLATRLRTMSGTGESFACRGANYSVTLTTRGIDLKEMGLDSKLYELPINRITSVVVQRKTIIPFLSLAIFAGAAAAIANYNALWFIMNLPPPLSREVMAAALLVAGCAILPTALRAWFVSVTITWDGEPRSFLVRFVPGYTGRKLARRFQELSTGAVP